MRIIGVEEHFSTKETRARFQPLVSTNTGTEQNQQIMTPPRDDLDMIDKRIVEMDQFGIDMQVLSLGPGIEQYEASFGTELARITNNRLAEIIKRYSDRFSGFACIAPQDPLAASHELERAVKELGLKGAMVKSNVQGEYLDNQKFWVIFETAEKLGVPIYIHPKEPSPQMIKPFTDYPELAGAMWGYSVEAGLHAMRLICSGVFNYFPNLRIILGHLGEGIPFWLWRLDSRSEKGKYKKKPSQYFKEHFYVSVSGMYWEPALLMTVSAIGSERILFATDYPSESFDDAIQSIKNLPLSDKDKENIWHLNAERLLKL